MITTSELRQGNWATGKEGKPVQVKEIMTAMVVIDSSREARRINRNTVHHSSLSGIPLTPDVLHKAGFDDSLTKGELILYLDQGFIVYDGKECFFEIDGDRIGKEIKYLHQLQNLYFALTGEELKIDL